MGRSLITAVAGLIVAVFACALPPPVNADQPVAPSAPTNLSMTLPSGDHIRAAGGWTNQGRITLHFNVQVGTSPLTPQVELVRSSAVFAGSPNFTGTALSSSGSATVVATGLRDQKTYHWQARVVDNAGNASDWVAYGGLNSSTYDFGVDQTPPSRPIISSSTNPDQNRWYNTSVEQLSWISHDQGSGVAGYSFVLERQAHVIPPGNTVAQRGARISNLGNGTWYVALRSVDHAGNWSPTATYRLQLDRQPAHLTWLSPAHFTFNPYHGPTTVRFRVDKNASTQLALYRVGAIRPVARYDFPSLHAGQVVSITWSGKNHHGKYVRRGYYFFSATLTDHANNLSRLNVGGIVVRPMKPQTAPSGTAVFPDGGKRIIVSLGKQTLYAYDGSHLVLQTFVTTGNPRLPTPIGHYSVMQRISPFEFISPWPLGSPFYYAPSWVQWALLFRDGGYFLHDAPWRSNFGPGSNAQLGTPGTNYTGSHGCVNIPPVPMQFLWNWTPDGTPVDVVP